MEKEKLAVLMNLDTAGYIMGYQQEFWDGDTWQTPFDTTNTVLLPQSEIDKISLGATKLVDGHLVVDKDKQAELEAQQPSIDEPVDYGAKIADLEAQLKQANDATLELADMMLGGDSDATTSTD
ncbi:phage infection protein [Lacticaseibacillus daqingensis]|uniref:phage infection protein n=1 Tax=Lacticaseibacillus daqingensis TaxID=2486014 RepID=UPI000F79A31E|nr:phage infection protein [Lacticaseibacillus daqingensis]